MGAGNGGGVCWVRQGNVNKYDLEGVFLMGRCVCVLGTEYK